jgi:hypothetical protein
MRRNIEEVLRSQNKMLERNGTGGPLVADNKMRGNYEFHLKKVYYQLDHLPNFDALYVDYPAVVENPLREARRITEFLGGKLNVEAMAKAVESSLYRNRVSTTPAHA